MSRVEEKSETSLQDIHILVEGFENFSCMYKATDVFVQAEFLNIVIGESPQQPVTHDPFVPHNFHCILRFDPKNKQCMDDLVSNPIMFNVFQIEGIFDVTLIANEFEPEEKPEPSPPHTKAASAPGKSDPKKVDSKKPVVTSGFEPHAVGRCNIDLLPLLLGETEIIEWLTVEQEEIHFDEEMIPHEALPRIKVHILIEKNFLTPDDIECSNIINFSVQSIYNPCETMTENLFYSIGTIMPTSENEIQPIVITDGVTVIDSNSEMVKVWCNLAGVQNRSSYSQYCFDSDFRSIKNTLGIDMKDTLESKVPRIEWNLMRRCWMNEDALGMFETLLKKFKVWPIELYATPTPPEHLITVPDPTAHDQALMVTPSPPKQIPELLPTDLHYMGFVDISKLLYPGITHIKVACQLRTYNEKEMIEATGFKEKIFKASELPPPTKGSAKDPKKGTPAPPVEELPPEASMPLFNTDNHPTFIIIEIDLEKPIFPKRTLEDLTQSLRSIIPPRHHLPTHILNARIAEKHFRDCIAELIENLYQQHNHFSSDKDISQSNQLVIDEETAFTNYLVDVGVYQKFMTTLRKKINIIIASRLPFNGNVDNKHDFERYIDEVYCYLVKEINSVVNTIMGPSIDFKETQVDSKLNSENSLYYAKEAEEMQDMKLARRYYFERIKKHDTDADTWFDFAIFNSTIGHSDEAFECSKECVTLNPTHEYGLILYGILLSERKHFKDAETCFLAMISYYPQSYLGWIVLYLYYLKKGQYEGVDVAYEMALKAHNRHYLDEMHMNQFFSEPELSWDVSLWQSDQIFIQAAVLLIKLRCFEFAEIALAQDLIEHPHSPSYNYYMGVSFYLTHRYSEALKFLEEAMKVQGNDIAVGGLLGHCYFKMENNEKVVEFYEPLLYTFQRPDDIHMIYLRLGIWYRHHNRLEESLKILLLACKYSPTPRTWLEAGITEIALKEFESAEDCLIEANMLDNKLSDVWKQLAVVNIALGRATEADECYKYAMILTNPEKKEIATTASQYNVSGYDSSSNVISLF